MEERKQNGVENIVEGREREAAQRDKLRDKFELLLGLLSATARIQDSVNYASKCFIIKHFAVLIVAPTTAEAEKKGRITRLKQLEIHCDGKMSE